MSISLSSFNLKMVKMILMDISFCFLFVCFNHKRTFFFLSVSSMGFWEHSESGYSHSLATIMGLGFRPANQKKLESLAKRISKNLYYIALYLLNLVKSGIILYFTENVTGGTEFFTFTEGHTFEVSEDGFIPCDILFSKLFIHGQCFYWEKRAQCLGPVILFGNDKKF